MYQFVRPSALSMDMIFTVGLFIFCTRKMYQGKGNARYKLAMHLETQLYYLQKYQFSTYYISSHCTMYYSFYTLRLFCVDILAQAFLHHISFAIDLRLVAMANFYSCAYFGQSIHFLFPTLSCTAKAPAAQTSFLRRVPRSLRGDECYKPGINLNIIQLNSFSDSPCNYFALLVSNSQNPQFS